MKKGLSLVVCICLILTLTGCIYKRFLGNRPWDQPNTTWVSEDNSIVFYIDSNWTGYGTLHHNGEIVEFCYSEGPSVEIWLYTTDADGKVTDLEYWYGDFKRNDRFTATVEESTFFKKGDKITFYRVDNENTGAQAD